MKLFCAVAVLLAALTSSQADDGGCPISERTRGHENVEWSIAYGFHLTDSQKDLPRVLLVGDSICNGYQGGVRNRLEGKMAVSYWVSSYCVTSPGYLKLLAFQLDEARFAVVHFNNGLHSLDTPTEAYQAALKRALLLVREKQPWAKIVWVPSTPLKDPVKTAKVKERNAAALQVVQTLGNITVNDLFALLDPLDRETNWSDVYHHKRPVIALEADQVAKCLLSFALPSTNRGK